MSQQERGHGRSRGRIRQRGGRGNSQSYSSKSRNTFSEFKSNPGKNYQPPLGNYQSPPGNYQPPPGNYQPPPGNYQSPPGNYQPPPGNYQPPPGNYQPPAGNYQPPPSNYQPPPSTGNYQMPSSTGNYHPSQFSSGIMQPPQPYPSFPVTSHPQQYSSHSVISVAVLQSPSQPPPPAQVAPPPAQYYNQIPPQQPSYFQPNPPPRRSDYVGQNVGRERLARDERLNQPYHKRQDREYFDHDHFQKPGSRSSRQEHCGEPEINNRTRQQQIHNRSANQHRHQGDNQRQRHNIHSSCERFSTNQNYHDYSSQSPASRNELPQEPPPPYESLSFKQDKENTGKNPLVQDGSKPKSGTQSSHFRDDKTQQKRQVPSYHSLHSDGKGGGKVSSKEHLSSQTAKGRLSEGQHQFKKDKSAVKAQTADTKVTQGLSKQNRKDELSAGINPTGNTQAKTETNTINKGRENIRRKNRDINRRNKLGQSQQEVLSQVMSSGIRTQENNLLPVDSQLQSMQITEEKKKRQEFSRKKKYNARNKQKKAKSIDTESQPEELASCYLTKASLQILSPFKDATSLKEAVLMYADEAALQQLQFVEESIICSEKRGVCTVIISAERKQLGKRLIKNLCERMRIGLKTKVMYDIAGEEQEHSLVNKQNEVVEIPSCEHIAPVAGGESTSAKGDACDKQQNISDELLSVAHLEASKSSEGSLQPEDIRECSNDENSDDESKTRKESDVSSDEENSETFGNDLVDEEEEEENGEVDSDDETIDDSSEEINEDSDVQDNEYTDSELVEDHDELSEEGHEDFSEEDTEVLCEEDTEGLCEEDIACPGHEDNECLLEKNAESVGDENVLSQGATEEKENERISASVENVTTTKLSLVVDKIFPVKEDFIDFLSKIFGDKTAMFELVPGSVITATSTTLCELTTSSKQVAKDIVRLANSSKQDGSQIRCFILQNVPAHTS